MGALENYKKLKNQNEKKQIAKKNCLVRSVRERNRLRPNTYPTSPNTSQHRPKLLPPKIIETSFCFRPAPRQKKTESFLLRVKALCFFSDPPKPPWIIPKPPKAAPRSPWTAPRLGCDKRNTKIYRIAKTERKW